MEEKIFKCESPLQSRALISLTDAPCRFLMTQNVALPAENHEDLFLSFAFGECALSCPRRNRLFSSFTCMDRCIFLRTLYIQLYNQIRGPRDSFLGLCQIIFSYNFHSLGAIRNFDILSHHYFTIWRSPKFTLFSIMLIFFEIVLKDITYIVRLGLQ